MNLSHESGFKRWNYEYLHRSYFTWRVLYVYRQVYITQLLTNGAQKLPPPVLHVIWKKMTWTCWLVFFLMHCMHMRRGVEHFPKKTGGDGCIRVTSHLRVLLVKHTNIFVQCPKFDKNLTSIGQYFSVAFGYWWRHHPELFGIERPSVDVVYHK